MTVAPSDLRKIPLFQKITDAHLREMTAAFKHTHVKANEVLFEPGGKPDRMYLLVSGEIALREGDETRLTVTPIAPIGELGALTDLARRTTAVTTKASEIWTIGAVDLMEFFEKHGDVAF